MCSHRELDMDPYTVAGLARIEGEALAEDLEGATDSKTSETNYHLRGMVVHSGQASGGHYYSYIKSGASWYKFDDGDVTEAKMEDDEELRAQCYGGEYMSEVFDPMLKRMTYRKQKRWWNAYMLFYTRADLADAVAAGEVGAQLARLKVSNSLPREMTKKPPKMPLPIEKSVQKQNVRFLHQRNMFSPEFFQFMKRLIGCNAAYLGQSGQSDSPAKEAEELCMLSIHLASKFLFSIGLRAKKSLRGPAQEWYEVLSQYLRCSKQARLWFCQQALFAHPQRFCEYILECPSAEVRKRETVLSIHPF